MANMHGGDSTCTAGLSKKIYDNWKGDARSGMVDLDDPAQSAAKDSVQAICWAIAKAVVDQGDADGVWTKVYP